MSRSLIDGGIDVIRAYEDAATAIGRLDASARVAPAGLRELLVLRCIAAPTGADHSVMIALVRPDGEGADPFRSYASAVRTGAARARGGALPSIASLHELLTLPMPVWDASLADNLLRDTHERTPPVLKAALAVGSIRAAAVERSESTQLAQLCALAATFVLCVGGATTDAWLTLPRGAPGETLRDTFAALAREARAAERGLTDAQELFEADAHRVRESLGRAAYSALDVLGLLHKQIVITVPETARALGQTAPTAGAAVARLVELGIAREVTGKARSRAFAYEGIVRALAP